MISLIVLVCVAVIFLSRVLFFLYGVKKEINKPLATFKYEKAPFISVIVPARNEEHNIESCVRSIFASAYPKDKFELIVVNDRSSDKTGEILSGLQKEFSNLNVISIKSDSEKVNLQGKPGAIQKGVDSATGDIILITDADCQVHTEWITAHARTYIDSNNALTASYALVDYKTPFEKFQSIEWIYMNSLGAGSVGNNIPMGCYGNNMSFRKKDFDDLGGYHSVKFTLTEDLALLLHFKKAGKSIRYLVNPDSIITTNPVKNMKEYISQHQRWTRGGTQMGWKAVAFVFTTLVLWSGLAYSIITLNLPLALAILFIRYFGDFLFLSYNMRKTGKPELVKAIPLYEIFFLILELFAPAFLLKRNVVWKGQVLKNAPARPKI